MKKKIIIISAVLLLLVGAIIAYLLLNNNKEKQTKDDNTIEEKFASEVEETMMKFINGSMRLSDMEAIIGGKSSSQFLIAGSDSYLSESIKDNKLKAYYSLQKKLVKKVEKKVSENFAYKIVDYGTSLDDEQYVTIKYKPYYYNEYISQLNIIKMNLLKLAGYDMNNYNEKDKSKIEEANYKAKVVAIKIMDQYLSNYENKEEWITNTIIGNSKDITRLQNSYNSFFLQLNGVSSTKIRDNKNFESELNSKATEYVYKAIENELIDSNNPLKLI